MYPKLLHIYGPFELNSFNAAIILGIAIFAILALRHPGRSKLISTTDALNISLESAIAGIIGGRLLHLAAYWNNYETWFERLSIWNGGMAILGSAAGVFIYATYALYRKQYPIFACFDIAAIYAPLIHSIARLGCFLVGCCYGVPTAVPWGITYSNPDVLAPLHVKIHPTQLYSSLAFFSLFVVLQLCSPRLSKRSGQLSMLYFMGMSLERLLLDFYRGDRVPVGSIDSIIAMLSFYQWCSLGLFLTAFVSFLYFRYAYNNDKHIQPSDSLAVLPSHIDSTSPFTEQNQIFNNTADNHVSLNQNNSSKASDTPLAQPVNSSNQPYQKKQNTPDSTQKQVLEKRACDNDQANA